MLRPLVLTTALLAAGRSLFTATPVAAAGTPFDWINRIIAVGIGHRRADGPVYSIFDVL